jgi:hypothetical protein
MAVEEVSATSIATAFLSGLQALAGEVSWTLDCDDSRLHAWQAVAMHTSTTILMIRLMILFLRIQGFEAPEGASVNIF